MSSQPLHPLGSQPDRLSLATFSQSPNEAFAQLTWLDPRTVSGTGQDRRRHHIPAKLRPDFIFTTLQDTAVDVNKRAGPTIAPYPIEHPNGFDFDSGFGFVDAVKALTVVKTLHASTD